MKKKIGMATVAAVAAMLAGSALTATPAQAESNVDINSVLAAANASRADYGAAPLKWDSSLLDGAKQKANSCTWGHDKGQTGENLFVGGGTRTFLDAQSAWMSESAAYDWNNPGFSMATGHFTQAVWKATTGIAVAINVCPPQSVIKDPDWGDFQQTIIVARYSPAGNATGQFPANVGKKV